MRSSGEGEEKSRRSRGEDAEKARRSRGEVAEKARRNPENDQDIHRRSLDTIRHIPIVFQQITTRDDASTNNDT